MEIKALKDVADQIGRTFEEFKTVNDDRLKKLAESSESRARELNEQLDKMNVALTEQAKERRRLEVEAKNHLERIEELETRAKTPGKTVAQKLTEEHEEKFWRFIRTGMKDMSLGHEIKTLEKQMSEQKDVTIGAVAAGGYALPEVIGREVEKQEKLYSPVFEDVKFITVGTSDYKELVDLTGATDGWVAETGSRSATSTPSLRECAPTWGEQYAYPQASEWALQDMFFNVQDWLTQAIADTFAISAATAVVSGNGTARPTGMTNTTPTTVDDFGSPLRSAAIYQYVASAASPDAITPDSLLDVQYKLNSRYRSGAKYIFNSTTAGAIRKLKDTTNQYLWQPGLQMGEPDRLLGYPTSIWEQMASVGSNTFPVAFGNFKRGYLLTQRVGIAVTIDQVTNPGYVRFYVRRRLGGIPLNNNAIKFIRTT